MFPLIWLIILWSDVVQPTSGIKTDFMPESMHLSTSSSNDDYSFDFAVEVMVVADHSMKQFHGDGLEQYILTLFNIVDNVFSSATLRASVRIVVAHIHVINDTDTDALWDYPAEPGPNLIIDSFCRYKETLEHNRYDVALLLSRKRLLNGIIGLAERTNGFCTRSNCAFATDVGLGSAFVIVHEIGHLLCINHDSPPYCKQLVHGRSFIMDRQHSTNLWSWSNCSSETFIGTVEPEENHRCLIDHQSRLPYVDIQRRMDKPGVRYSLDDQCVLSFGNGYRHSSAPDGSRAIEHVPCKVLYCSNNQSDIISSHLPWADGSPCETTGRCFHGKCDQYYNSRVPVNGRWSAWSNWSTCSKTCGGGLQTSSRECSTLPINGGRYCTGRRMKYLICSTQQCPDQNGRTDRERVCQVEFHHETSLATKFWRQLISEAQLPTYPYTLSCRLTCTVVYDTNLRNYTIRVEPARGVHTNGLKCGDETQDATCINGKCRRHGCDGIFGSLKRRDKCLECDGLNRNCTVVGGTQRIRVGGLTSPEGYQFLYRIPKGATSIYVINLDIQPTIHFITLKDDTGEFVNRDRVIKRGGALVYFTRNVWKNNIHITGPTEEDIDIWISHNMHSVHVPQVKHEYWMKQ